MAAIHWNLLRQSCLVMALLGLSGWFASPLSAQNRLATATADRTDRDDATLRDVFFVGLQNGIAVGDRGTVLKTEDGGETWNQIAVPSEFHFRSVCFISQSEGWIAGSGTAQYSGASVGTVLLTNDGGATWTVACEQGLPALKRIQFFTDVDGIAVGDVTERCPTGVLKTADGGRSWTPVAGDQSIGWTTAEFASPGFGLLAGPRGTVGHLGGDAVQRNPTEFGLRGFHASCLERSTRTVWAVGDGGLVVRSVDGGGSWLPSGETLPPESRMVFDFRTVAAWQQHVWVAGAPGSVIWHSPDAGATWEAQPTPETTPIHAVRCLGGEKRIAVGALGKILIQDEGQPWRVVRGAGRRLAALAVHAHSGRVSLMQMARDAGDRGYRVGAWSLIRKDVEPGTEKPLDGSRQFEDALLAAGAGYGATDWRLPVSLPGLERQPQALLADWSVLADQKLNDMLVSMLVTQIRTWRPDVLLMDEAPQDDAPTRILHAALPVVLQHAAADRGRMAPLWNVSGLPEWKVSRVYARTQVEQEGLATLDPSDWLPNRQASLGQFASSAALRMGPSLASVNRREGFRPLEMKELSEAAPREFFTGLSLPAGGDARRAMLLRQDDDPTKIEAVTKQRNLRRLVGNFLDNATPAAQWLNQLSAQAGELPPDEAVLTLSLLVDELVRKSDWESAETAAVDLVTRYPAHPMSRGAMRWLIGYWSSEELEYARARGTTVTRQRVEQVAGAAPAGAPPVTLAGGTVTVGDLQSVIGVSASAVGKTADQGQFTGRLKLDASKRFAQARMVIDAWTKLAPEEVAAADVQYQIAALYRRNGKPTEAEAIATRLVQETHGASRRIGHGELWLKRPATSSLQMVHRIQRASKPPVLDGHLTDDCWENARELRVAGAPPKEVKPASDDPLEQLDNPQPTADLEGSAFCLMAYDGACLYLAANVTRHAKLPQDLPSYAGRPYDADLDAFDRLGFALDLNRDYQSAYTFEVDQRGWTRDACWTHQGWNPKWFVACDADDRTWRIEVAIPWEELCPVPPGPGSAFALGVTRTMPGIGRQSWVWPGTAPISAESMGLLMLE